MDRTERNARIIRKIEAYTAYHTRTPEAARAALIAEGIYRPDGKLRPEFGGSG